jgi:hypothetical protein
MIFIVIKNYSRKKGVTLYYYVNVRIIIVHDCVIFNSFQVIQFKKNKNENNVCEMFLSTLYSIYSFQFVPYVLII